MLEEAFQIYRTRPQTRSGWQNGIDYFGIPTSLCGSSDYECNVFNALNGAPNCSCTCPGEKSTFTSFENQWQCIENGDVRTNLQSQQYSKPGEKACEQDMETLFVNEFSNASLHLLKAGDEKAISIGSTWSSCELDLNHSWYFGCSDSRLSSSIYLQTMMNLLTLTKGDFYFNLKVGSNVLNTHLLRGRIINLGIYCRNTSTMQTQRGCLLFKLGGNMTCESYVSCVFYAFKMRTDSFKKNMINDPLRIDKCSKERGRGLWMWPTSRLTFGGHPC
ncbi:uncharacterized protein LOC110068387 [Orbicella faveolata]|uniref:uncharacterized protein LOC110068387 n=1 Tax=Orbicella faveolata TaxID=48498 RepID=UPI0009E53371|nr:uncharacterized protein LOC110068387 [Orbicella faveolata]